MKMVEATTFNINQKKAKEGLYLKKTVLYCEPISRNNADSIFRGSSMVEHATVNRRVVGSSPSRGARKRNSLTKVSFLFFCFIQILSLLFLLFFAVQQNLYVQGIPFVILPVKL